jgi:hypothetical protein
MPQGADHILFHHVLGQAQAFGDFLLGEAFDFLPDENPPAVERQLRQGPLDGIRQLDRVHELLRVATVGRTLLKGVQPQCLAPVFAAMGVHRDIARGLMQVSAWLLNLGGTGLKHPYKGVVRQVLGLLTVSQAARPGADQLFVILEKACSAGRLGNHRGGTGEAGRE